MKASFIEKKLGSRTWSFWEEIGEPKIDIGAVLHRQPSTPEDGSITTALARQRERGREPFEYHTVTVLPQVPQEKKAEGGGGGGRRGRWQRTHGRVGCRESRVGPDAHRSQELLRKGTLKHDVVGGFQGSRAEGTPAVRHGEDPFAMEVGAALHASPHKKPSEEMDLGRSPITPNKLEVGIALTANGAELVESGGAQDAATLGTKRQRASVGRLDEATVAEGEEKGAPLEGGGGGETWHQRAVEAVGESLGTMAQGSVQSENSSGITAARGPDDN
jgi:hypothetical protein